MKIENIKACAFDAYGTWFYINSEAKGLANKNGKDWLSFSATGRTVQLEYTWLRSLMKRYVDFWKVTEDSLEYAMASHGIDKNYKNELLKLYKKLNPYPELKDCLKSLKSKKLKICILSNGSPDLLKQLIANEGVQELFDDLRSVEDVKIFKPDPQVYE